MFLFDLGFCCLFPKIVRKAIPGENIECLIRISIQSQKLTGITMGRNKNRFKRDKLLRNKRNANSGCCNLETNNAPEKLTNFKNPFVCMTKVSENYGIRHLLQKTIESRNDSVPDGNPKCIDLSNDDGLCEEEVIDLTQTSTKSVECDANEPTVIDISEEEPNGSSESEDVCVIGTYLKPSGNLPVLNKPLLNDGLGELIRCTEKIGKNWLMFRPKNGAPKLKKKKNKRMLRLEAKEKLGFSRPLQNMCKENFGHIGSNVYVNSPLSLPSNGLRPIIIDGNNVAYTHSNYHFCCKRLEICINYFKEKGHKVTAFVPQFRMSSKKNDDPKLLRKLEKEGYVVLTPSKEIDGRKIVPYDDRFIVQTAVLKGGIIVSRDNYKDLLHENPAWAETIKYRTLAFTWVDDVLMFPEDPLGEFGPKLDEFLRFH